MTQIKAHPGLETVTPDTVAECWDGVFSFGNLYEQLWACVDKYQEIDREDNGPHDVIGLNSVADFWDDFSPENQAKLNELAAAQDKMLGITDEPDWDKQAEYDSEWGTDNGGLVDPMSWEQ